MSNNTTTRVDKLSAEGPQASQFVAVWEWDLVSGRAFYSKDWKTLRGCSDSDISHWPEESNKRVHPDDRKRRNAEHAKLICGELSQAQCRHRVEGIEGDWIWIDERTSAVCDEQGKPIRLLGCDILASEQTVSQTKKVKQADDDLMQLQDRLRRVLQPSSIGTWEWIWRENRFVWDAEIFDIYGVDPKDFQGVYTDWSDRLHPDDLERATAEDLYRVEQDGSESTEFRIVRPDGQVRHIYSRFTYEKNEAGEMVRTVGVNLDITARKEMELANDALAKATKAKDEFLAAMSHELRTPLSAILAMTEGLKQGVYGDTTPKQLKSLEVVEQSGRHLLDLINEILDLSKIESGQVELDLTLVDVRELCESCSHMVSQQAEKNDIQMSLGMPLSLPEFEGDETRLRQVLINLMTNAVKFTPAGGKVKVAVEHVKGTAISAEDSTENDVLRIDVCDTGIGIDQKDMDLVFEPFAQVDNSLVRTYEGSGLGLSLAKRFVELHDGLIRVQSEPGKGSCFTVELPYRKRNQSVLLDVDDCDPKSTDDGIATASQRRPAMVLLAEDNDSVALAVTPILEISNLSVLRAVNGLNAIEMAVEHTPDLILMDIQMPVLDGLEAIRRIRALPQLVDTPIIALTGFAMQKDSERCIEAGADIFISKPCDMKDLVASINRLLVSR